MSVQMKTEEVSKTVIVEIPDLTKNIDDAENKKKPIDGPEFKVGGGKFYVQILPEGDGSTHIAVYLRNPSKEEIKTSFSIKHESGVKFDRKDQEIAAGGGFGASKFLSHVAYKKWAEEHGDVFRLEVKIIERYVHVLYFCRKGL